MAKYFLPKKSISGEYWMKRANKVIYRNPLGFKVISKIEAENLESMMTGFNSLKELRDWQSKTK